MPLRPFSREQTWLLPPSLDEMVPADHPARFVAAFVDGLDAVGWAEMAIAPHGDPAGAPAYHPRALLGAWIYGFVSGVRSARKLEAACREQLPYLWLTGCQRADHNTLWRFYKTNRQGMRKLLKGTVRTAVKLGLVDLALQAVDGTKIAGNASRWRTFDAKGLEKLLARTDKAITELEARNCAEGPAAAPALPRRLHQSQALREQVQTALAVVRAEDGPTYVNLTDGQAGLVKGRQGVVAGYNAQAVVSPLVEPVAGGRGMLITAAEVSNASDDHGQLLGMLAAAEEMTGQRAAVSLADGGYHSGANLVACEERGYAVLLAEPQTKAARNPYHKSHFCYEGEADTYLCPGGQRLAYAGVKRRAGEAVVRVYRARVGVCRVCPAFGKCTKNKRQGRELEVGPHEEALREHRKLMAREESKAVYRRRKVLVEPVFGVVKELQGARRLLLRGLTNVRAEWSLLATAYNLRSLWRVWRRLGPRGLWTGWDVAPSRA